MKRRRNGQRKRGVALVALALTTALLATSFSVQAATNVFYQTSNGGTISFAPQEQLIADQKTELTNCGFSVSTSGTDDVTLNMEETSAWNSVGTTTLQNQHSALVENGILSYIIYDNAVCQITTDLVVCLDFSAYKISSFGENFLNGLTYALTGSSSFWGMGADFDENTDNGTVSLIDAALGRSITDKRAVLHLGGMGTYSKSTISYYDENNELLETKTIGGYSLHIVLPRNNWSDELSTITFEENSLTSEGIGQLAASPPTSIGLDISNVLLSEEKDYLDVHENATGGNTEHFHYIGSTSIQLEYALKKSLNTVLSSELNKTDYVEEIFVKPYANTHFCRIYAGVGLESSKLYISTYDQPSGANYTAKDMLALVRLFRWLKYRYDLPTKLDGASVDYRHYERDENNKVLSEVGIVTCDWTGEEKTFGTGESAVTATFHSVVCSHRSDIVTGYFSESALTYYIYDEETGEHLPVLDE